LTNPFVPKELALERSVELGEADAAAVKSGGR
jgi:hypothetical protein